jgi:vesicle-associated membrane protein 4
MEEIKIKYLFVGEVKTSQTLLEINIAKNSKTPAECKKIFTSFAKLNENLYEQRNKISSGDSIYFFIVKKTDDALFYFAETKNDYPDRMIFKLFDELTEKKTVSKQKSESQMKDEVIKAIHQNEQSDSLSSAQADINDIKVDINKSLKNQMRNLENINELKDRSDNIKKGADAYRKDAHELERATWWQNMKWRIIIFVAIVGLILIIVLPIVLSKK